MRMSRSPEIMADDMILALEANRVIEERVRRGIGRDNALKLFPRLAN